MSWIDLLEKKEAFHAIFGTTLPKLTGIRLHEVRLHQDGPAITLRLDLDDFPRLPPEKWRSAGYNTVQLALSFWGVSETSIQGWTRNNVGTLRLDRHGPTGVAGNFSSPGLTLRTVCDFVLLDGMTAYINTTRPSGPNGSSPIGDSSKD